MRSLNQARICNCRQLFYPYWDFPIWSTVYPFLDDRSLDPTCHTGFRAWSFYSTLHIRQSVGLHKSDMLFLSNYGLTMCFSTRLFFVIARQIRCDAVGTELQLLSVNGFFFCNIVLTSPCSPCYKYMVQFTVFSI